MDFVNELQHKFKSGNIIIKLIFVNVTIFIIQLLLDLLGLNFVQSFFMVSSDPFHFILRFWALVSYQFMHEGVMHILFNMLWLYWFGEMFLHFFNRKQLLATYLLGGFVGAGLFFVTYNLIPALRQQDAMLLGASAATTAIAVAVATYRPNLEINLMLFGPVKIKYLVIVMIILDFVSINSGQNIGGHFSHIGGAAFGFFFGQEMLKGRDITKGFNLFLDWLFSLFNPRRPKMKVTYGQTHKGREKDYHYNTNKKASQAEIDQILEKISRSGYESLSSEERDKLFRASK